MEIKEKQEMGRVESGDKGEAREGQTRQRRRPVLAQWHVWCAADRQDAGGGRCVGGGGQGGGWGGVSGERRKHSGVRADYTHNVDRSPGTEARELVANWIHYSQAPCAGVQRQPGCIPHPTCAVRQPEQ